jgi:hypothetical protein
MAIEDRRGGKITVICWSGDTTLAARMAGQMSLSALTIRAR